MSAYDDLDPVSLSRELLDRRRALLEEGRQLISQKREILRELQAARRPGRSATSDQSGS